MSHRYIKSFKYFFSGRLVGLGAALSVFAMPSGTVRAANPTHVIEVPASNRIERSKIANLGFAIDEFRSDTVYIYGTEQDAKKLQAAGFQAKAHVFKEEWFKWTPRGSELSTQAEYRYHSYDEVTKKLTEFSTLFPNVTTLISLGSTVENRNVPMIRISGKSAIDAETQKIPAIIYMGCHHAREHLSVEMPLLFIEHLLTNYGKDPNITRLVDSREIFIAPMINPDGHVYDFRPGQRGRMWRKNRRPNSNGTFGVDLNRNYGFKWGTGGSSTDGNSDVFMGPAPFSEPETINIRDFIRSQPRITTLLSFHTFSELILYPWGHTYDDIGQNGLGKTEDFNTFKKMATTMAAWNGYTPQAASDLYIASGDTTDWAYGELGIFAFTFELTPTSLFGGGFYPEPRVIQPTFNANLKPLLYMLEFADNPHRSLTQAVPDYLANEVSPASRGVPVASFNDIRL
jgi:carboxypeptidase T